MKKYSFLLLSLILTLSLSAQNKKNILFIAVDDLKPTIGAYGDVVAKTPNIDKLASKGFVFKNAYTQQAVCGPSRASMLTGWRPDRTKVWDLKTYIRSKNPNVVTLPQYFKQNGYITCATGKIFDPRSVDKRTYDGRSWTIPYKPPYKLPHTSPYPVLGEYQSKQAKAEYNFAKKLGELKGLKGKQLEKYLRKNFRPSTDKADVPDDYYFDGWIANDAIKKIDRFAKSNKPFLLMVGFKKPHLPFTAPKKYWDLYDEKDLKLAKFQRHAKGSPDVAYHNNPELRSYTDIPKAIDEYGELDPEKQKELIHGYYAATSYIDAQIGKVINELEKQNLLDKTIIVLWGDHGFHLGDHGLWTKHTNFEQATHLPLIIIDPSKKPGETSIPVESLDIYPTLCDLAGLEKDTLLQGQSLVPLLEGKDIDKKYAVSQWPRPKGGMGYSIRTDRYRYTEWYEDYVSTKPRKDKNIIGRELYDYQADPLETKNLVKNKKYKEVAAELEKKLHDFLDSQVGTDLVPDASLTFMANEVPGKPKGTPLRELVAKNFKPGTVYVGATVSYRYDKKALDLLAEQFSYTTPENAAKQSYVHPEPGIWRWDRIDNLVRFAKNHNMVMRLHGPVSPQASKWALEDNRTPEELEQVMEEYMTRQCKRFNGNPTIKWMDVVNETVNADGTWFGPKPGTDQWENPWLKIGLNEDSIPIYIVKAFEIANKYAPDIKLIYNQHVRMEPAAWEKVKKTVLYLKKKGLRVDGIGWQAHLRPDVNVALNKKDLKYLEDLIDWAHSNGLEFHVTEIDYTFKNSDAFTKKMAEEQAVTYANILKVLLKKRNTGVVGFNTWGLYDGPVDNKHRGNYRFIFDEKLRAKPAYYAIQKVLENPDDLELTFEIPESVNEFDDKNNLIKNGGFEGQIKPWLNYGETELDFGGNQHSGESCLMIAADKSGANQFVNVKKNTDYEVSAWLKSYGGEKVKLVVLMEGEKNKVVTSSDDNYKKVSIKFNSGNHKTVKIAVNKWLNGDNPAWIDDVYMKEVK